MVSSPYLSVQIRDFQPEKSAAPKRLLHSGPVRYTIETSCEESGDIFCVRRRFNDFYIIRKALLAECRQCKTCQEYSKKLRAIPFPTRLPCLSKEKQQRQRSVQLTTFLRELVELTSTVGSQCRMNGTYLCNTVGMFLGLKSLLRFALSKTDCEAVARTRMLRRQTSQMFPKLQRANSAPPRPSLRFRSVSSPMLFSTKNDVLKNLSSKVVMKYADP